MIKYIKYIIIPILVLLLLTFTRNNFLKFNNTVNRKNTIDIFNKIYNKQIQFHQRHGYYADNFNILNVTSEDLRKAGVYSGYYFKMGNSMIVSDYYNINKDLNNIMDRDRLLSNGVKYTVAAVYRYPTLKRKEILVLDNDGNIRLLSNAFIGSAIITWDLCELFLWGDKYYKYCNTNSNEMIIKKLGRSKGSGLNNKLNEE